MAAHTGRRSSIRNRWRRSAAWRWRLPTRTCCMWGAAKVPARQHLLWQWRLPLERRRQDVEEPGTAGLAAHSQGAWWTRAIPTWCWWRRSVMRLAPNASAASFAPPTAAKTGRRCCTWTITPAPPTWLFAPANANIVFAAMYQVQRQPWTFTSGGGKRAVSFHRWRRHLEATRRPWPAGRDSGPHRRFGVGRRFRARLCADRSGEGRALPLR